MITVIVTSEFVLPNSSYNQFGELYYANDDYSQRRMELYLSLEEKGVMGGDHLADVQPNHIYSFSKDSRKVSHFL